MLLTEMFFGLNLLYRDVKLHFIAFFQHNLKSGGPFYDREFMKDEGL